MEAEKQKYKDGIPPTHAMTSLLDVLSLNVLAAEDVQGTGSLQWTCSTEVNFYQLLYVVHRLHVSRVQ